MPVFSTIALIAATGSIAGIGLGALVVTGAAIGAVVGGAVAAVRGGNILKGVMVGGIIGGAVGLGAGLLAGAPAGFGVPTAATQASTTATGMSQAQLAALNNPATTSGGLYSSAATSVGGVPTAVGAGTGGAAGGLTLPMATLGAGVLAGGGQAYGASEAAKTATKAQREADERAIAARHVTVGSDPVGVTTTPIQGDAAQMQAISPQANAAPTTNQAAQPMDYRNLQPTAAPVQGAKI